MNEPAFPRHLWRSVAAMLVIATLLWAMVMSLLPAPDLTLAPMSAMPAFVHNAPPDAQIAYRYAATHHDLLSNFPCYCGCVYLGHKNNADCYIKTVNRDGTLVYDEHAALCGICVEITLDVKRLWAEGQSIDAIHAFIVQTYSGRGPST